MKRWRWELALFCVLLMVFSIVSPALGIEWDYFDPEKVVDTGNGVYVPEDMLAVTIEDNAQILQVPIGGTINLDVGVNPAQVDVGMCCVGCLGGFDNGGGCYSACPSEFGYCVCSGTTGHVLTPTVQVVRPDSYVDGVVSTEIDGGKLEITGLTQGTTTIGIQGVLYHPSHAGTKGEDQSYYKYRYTQVKTLTITTVAADAALPDVPAGLSTARGDTNVILTWGGAERATSYNIYLRSETDAEYTRIKTGVVTNSYKAEGLTNGTTYYFAVTAVNARGESAKSVEASGTPAVHLPLAPQNLSTTVEANSVKLSWTASDDTTSYKIYKGTVAGTYDSTPVAAGITKTTYEVTGLTTGTTYYFVVKSTNESGDSTNYSNEVSATPENAPPDPPARIVAVSMGSRIYLNWWFDSSGGLYPNYNVYMGTGSTYSKLTETPTGYSYYTTSRLTPGTYYFQVTAVDPFTGLESRMSTAVSAVCYDATGWATLGSPGFSMDKALNQPSFYMDNGTPYVAYISNSSRKVTVMKYSGVSEMNPSGWEPVGTPEFSESGGSAVSLFVDQAIPYVAYIYYDNDAGKQKLKAFRYTGTSEANPTGWELVGNGVIVENNITYPDLYVSGGIPYVACRNGNNGGKVEVYKLNGENGLWGILSGVPVSAGSGSQISLKFYNNTPYVAYQDGSVSNKATVRKYNGTDWETVGSAGFSPAGVDSPSLAIDGNGTPYIAFSDGKGYFDLNTANNTAKSSQATVMQYTGVSETNPSGWGIVGTPGFSIGEMSSASLYLYDGTPYIAFCDDQCNREARVMKFNGTGWETVGDATFSAGTAGYTRMVVNDDGIYISYSDGGNSGKMTVMKYALDSAPWQLTATAGDGQVTLNWGEKAGAASYNVYSKASTESDYAPIAPGVTDTTYTVTNLTNGTAYSFMVKAVNDGVESEPITASATPVGAITVPAKPANLTAVEGDQQVTLTWDAVAGATSYSIYWWDISMNEGLKEILASEYTDTATGKVTYTYTGLTNGNTYYISVFAKNSAGTSEYSNEVEVQPRVTVPAKPANLTAVEGDQQVTLTWDAVAGAISYSIYWWDISMNEGLKEISASEYTDTATGKVTYTYTGLTNGNTYYISVFAKNSAGTSEYSNEVEVQPRVTVLAAPADLRAEPGNGQVTLTWDAVAGAASYTVSWANNDMNVHESQTGITGTSYTVTGLGNGQEYDFEVTAVNTAGESEAATISATPNITVTEPEAPASLSAKAEEGQVTLTWSEVDGADSYNVYMGTASEEYDSAPLAKEISDTSYTATDLTNGTTYYFAVTAVNTAGESEKSEEASGTPEAAVAVPAVPTNLSAIGGDRQVDLTWNPSEGSVSYSVYMGTVSGAYDSTPLAEEISGTRYTATGLDNGQTYYFAVTAVNSMGASEKSEEASATCQKQNEEEIARMTGYTVSTNHTNSDTVPIKNGTDDQWINLTVNFDKEITIKDAQGALNELSIKLNDLPGNTPIEITATPTYSNGNSETSYPVYAQLALGGEGKSLQFTLHVGFAPYAGYLTVKPQNTITQITGADGTTPVAWSNIALYVPNGVKLQTVAQSAGNSATNTPAAVTKKVIAPASTTRAMIHMLFLKNGVPVGELDDYGANLTTHYHSYLTLDAAGFARMIPGWFNTAFNPNSEDADYPITYNGDTVTISEKNVGEGDVLDLRIYAYPQDRDTRTDKSLLNALIDEASSIDGTGYTAETYQALQNELCIAGSMANSIYYLQSEIDGETDALQTALDSLQESSSAPAAPASLSATAGDGQATLSWSAAEGAASYNVYKGTSAGEYDTTPLGTGITGTSYTATNLTNGTTYYFAVTAVNTAGESEKSNEAGATPKAASHSSGGGGGSSTPAKSSVTVSSDQNGSATISAASLKTASSVKVSGDVDLVLDANAVKAIGVDKDLTVSVNKVDNETLSAEVQEKIGNRPVFDIDITAGGKAVTDLGQGKVQITIPYTLGAGENAEQIVVYYIDTSGQIQEMSGAYYDAGAKAVVFTTNHLSRYAIGYKESVEEPGAGFKDVPAGHWAAGSINYLVAKGIINGKTATAFAPNDPITRAEFVKILAGIAGVDPTEYGTTFFSDVAANAWFAPYVAWAGEAGVSQGTDGKFNPNAPINRQEMAAMIARFVKDVKGATLPAVNESVVFADNGRIADYAADAVAMMQKAGIINGKANNQFAPQDKATRAEAAKMLATLMQIMEK
ncbi:fibronectin type III domain-containing protein [Candidatus Formimonas warabiya]|uniref:Fibronectin type III domain-containing protein n=1 Tax=Formimonas warabiya TaxID=1761012 RepID=A0A3G1KT37_FORW1|nr:fibronectin type III domain-containing protein [Candidatus Formimonas warabiya]ATW25596.1 hypothetical protein DCMF_13260 [Candidatus Formimonas warabiya]